MPVGEKGGKKDWDKTWEGYDEDDDRSVGHPSPVLLMEECGTPIEPEKFSIDDRCVLLPPSSADSCSRS